LSQNKESIGKLQVLRKAFAAYVTHPIVLILAKTHVTPNMVTWFGFIIILAATALAASGHLFAAGWVILLSGFFDIIDGALARETNQVTHFGGVLDSTLDRLSEAVILLGIMVFFLSHPEKYANWTILLIGIAMIASFLVSYVRSRAEGVGVDCQVGIFTRAERVVILALGLMINQLVIVLAIIAFMSIVTIIQRMVHVYQRTKK
jgi:CDP-diacylglycerol--glycerol-3-phosphate 3-phosphatidyltransferase